MRYLLDTNILANLVKQTQEEISNDIWEIIYDFSNHLYASSVSIVELFQLYRIGKIKTSLKSQEEILLYIKENFYVEILPYSENHIKTLSQLEVLDGHNDPFDHSIISHALAERMVLVSSDRKFENYTNQGLNFVFNKR